MATFNVTNIVEAVIAELRCRPAISAAMGSSGVDQAKLRADLARVIRTASGESWRTISDDEPIFVLRARDSLAPGAVYKWADDLRLVCSLSGRPLPAKFDDARKIAKVMQAWPDRRVPD